MNHATTEATMFDAFGSGGGFGFFVIAAVVAAWSALRRNTRSKG